jgi:hypothetical protein
MKEPKIKVWVARDIDGMLNMFLCKPIRGEKMWFGHGEFPLDKDDFPYIDWTSEPVEMFVKIVPDDESEEV